MTEYEFQINLEANFYLPEEPVKQVITHGATEGQVLIVPEFHDEHTMTYHIEASTYSSPQHLAEVLRTLAEGLDRLEIQEQ